MSNIGERIKEARRSKSLTQKELAKITGTPLMTLQRYEQGLSLPRYDRLFKIAAALEAPELLSEIPDIQLDPKSPEALSALHDIIKNDESIRQARTEVMQQKAGTLFHDSIERELLLKQMNENVQRIRDINDLSTAARVVAALADTQGEE